MEIDWEAELVSLLTELAAAQDDLLSLLSDKRQLLGRGDTEGLPAIQAREQQLLARLEQCHHRRGELLSQAAGQGLPSDSLRSLSKVVPREERRPLEVQVRQTAGRSRLLQNQCLTNWVLTQRTLLHLSQLLQVLGSGGRPSPTYTKDQSAATSGVLVDQAG